MKTQSANYLLAANHLPPAYVDIQEEIESDLSEIDKLCKIFWQVVKFFIESELRNLYKRRIKESFFDDDQKLHVKISWHTV